MKSNENREAASDGNSNNNSNNNNDNNDHNNLNYTDYLSSRHSSSASFDMIDDNSATLPRSNKKQQQKQYNNDPKSSPAIVELSSLFRSESSLFRRENDANEAKELLLERKRRGRLENGDEFDNDNGGESTTATPTQRRSKRRERRRQQQDQQGERIKRKDNEASTNTATEGDDGKSKSRSPSPLTAAPSLASISSSSNTKPLLRQNSINWGNFIGQKKKKSRPFFSPPIVGGGGELSSMTLGSIQEEGSDEEDEDPLMEVMDYLEDEIDGHTYDDLIPLQIRMALEDQVFGWDHFVSNILGHVGFTVGSYLLTFWLITFVVLHEVPWGQQHHDGIKLNNPWGMPHELFSFIRTSLSVGSAISTFRTIRRRRRVWLRQPYGSSSYLAGSRDAQRQQSSLEEADRRARRFVLGSKLWAKMQRSYTKRRNKYLARGVNRKLLKAQKMFERRHRNRAKLIRSTSATSLIDDDISASGDKKKNRAVASALTRHGHESSHHERVRILASTPADKMSVDDGSLGGGSSILSLATTEDLPMDYHSFVRAPGSQYVMDSHTLPIFAMESVSHDQMPFAHGEIKKIPYVHGGFFGAAPFMLTNPHWISILRILMPDVYVEISRRASYAPAPRLIHWAENNPVVAAYGTAHGMEFSGKVPTLEWDVFLDPYLVRRVEIVLSEKEAFLQRQKDARKKTREPKADENNNNTQYGTGEGEDGKVSDTNASSSQPDTAPPPINVADERLVLSYYDKEIKRRTTILVERMLIAHGNIVQLMMEQTGYLKKYNFSRVKRTRKTLGGGIFARQWMAIYSEAMKLGMGYDDDDTVSDSGTDGSFEEREDFDFANFSEMKDDHDARAHNRPGDVISPDAKSATAHSLDAAGFRTPPHDEPGGPPRKIVMMRNDDGESDDEDDGMSTDGDESIHSEPSLRKSGSPATPRMGASARKRRGRRGAATPPTLERVDATSLNKASVCPDKSISDSINMLKPIMQCSAPFGLVLDMKSRHVSRRVWALVIDYLRDAGARVEGIASFIVEEVRDITQYCSSSVNEIVFIHSAGDMQHGCHNGQIRRGDKVFFNAGSLLWDYPNLYDVDVLKNILWHRFQPCFDEQSIKEGYRLKPYAKTTSRPSPKNQMPYESESETCDESTLDDGDSTTSSLFTRLMINEKKKSMSDMEFVYEEALDGICSTIQQYKEYYQLSIGLYVQEFAIDEVAISLIVKYVNSNLHVYDLGLSWGGINGLTVKGVQPGRFTATDGLWNQRYGGMPWKQEHKPDTILE